MPKVVPPDTDQRIFEEIGRHVDGLGVQALHKCLADAISLRSLQRRLSDFVNSGKLVTVGKQRSLRYCLPSGTTEVRITEGPSMVEGVGEVYVPLSLEGEEIKKHVRQPRQYRTPVGYNQKFLEAYTPNETFYLPDDLREQLRHLGTPPDGDHPAGTFARDILSRLLIDLSWASSRLEGNTYSRLDTERLIEFGQAATGKDAVETQMILNHKAAIELLVEEAEMVQLNPSTIFNVHALLSDGLLADPSAGGRIRARPVDTGGSVYHPIAMPERLEELFRITLTMGSEIRDPFEQSFFVMVHLPYLQPFEDMNKRVSRLSANIPLIRHNLCPLSFIDVPQQAYVDGMLGVYEMNRIGLLRDVYVWAYERSCQQYLAVRQELVPPDTFRLRYRVELAQTIKSLILEHQAPTHEAVMKVLPPSLPESDVDKFIDLVSDEFRTLHQGNAIRFGVRPAQFAAWQEVHSK